MTQHKKFTTIKDRKQWAEKMLHKHDELCFVAIRKSKKHIDTI